MTGNRYQLVQKDLLMVAERLCDRLIQKLSSNNDLAYVGHDLFVKEISLKRFIFDVLSSFCPIKFFFLVKYGSVEYGVV